MCHKVGDVVDYVNDFGVLFPNHTILKIDGDKYYIDTDCYWSPVKLKNLYPCGTYIPLNKNINFKKGVAKFIGYDDNYRETYSYQGKLLIKVDGLLYSVNDYGEPMFPKEVA